MISFKFILGILFGFLVIGIFILGIISYQNNKASNQTELRVSHSYEVLNLCHEIFSKYKDVQLESQAFLAEPNPCRADAYKQTRDTLMPLVNALESLIRDNEIRQQEAESLRPLISALIYLTDSMLFLPKKKYPASQARRWAELDISFRDNIAHLKNTENKLLELHQKAYAQNIATFNRTFYFLLFLIGLLLATTFFAIRYNFNKRLKTQAELKRVSSLFTRLFYDSPIGIVISREKDGVIIDCNHAYCKLINYDQQTLIGNDPVSLGIVTNEKQRREILDNSRSMDSAQGIEVHLTPRAKEKIWAYISVQFIEIDDVPCILSAIQDITAHKNAEEKIQMALQSEVELNKLKSNFVTLASHEFRTPLTTILSSAFLLENYALGETKDKIKKHVTRIKNATNTLTSILDEFLSLTKIEERKVEPKPEDLNLKELIERLCLDYKSFAKAGQTIVYQHEGDVHIYSDPVLLKNIMNNLVSNAIKYSPEGSQIHISSNVNNSIHLSVRDSGIGISAEDQEHLFERFFRASNSGNIQGTGLGLHLMKLYVDMLHGSVRVNSAPGQGSEFTITLQGKTILHPTDLPPASFAPRLAASISPPPPPVMIVKPNLAISEATCCVCI